MVAVAWFSRKKRKNADSASSQLNPATVEHLEEFITSRRGVEAFIEQPTTFTPATLLLIAYDGESTRRQVLDVEWARRFAAKHGIPAYDAGVVGYPQRMRDYNSRFRSGS